MRIGWAGFFVAVVLGAAVLAPAGSAQPHTPRRVERAEIVHTVTVAEMTKILEKAGYAVEPERASNGETWLYGTEANGFRLNVLLRVCDRPQKPPGCLGVLFQVSYETSPERAPAARRAVPRFNREFTMAKAYIDTDGDVVLERYTITDGGVTLGHLGQDLDEFLYMPEEFVKMWDAEHEKPSTADGPV